MDETFKSKLEEWLGNAASDETVCAGALSMSSQVRQQIQNAMRAAQMEGVPAQETSIALKYLKPLFDFTLQADAQFQHSSVLAQGKKAALTLVLELGAALEPVETQVEAPAEVVQDVPTEG